jgi:prepilin-type processing-associated H-X9-DG protein
MSDEDLIGYIFDLLDPVERAAVAARVQSDPAVAARLAGLRAVAAPLVVVAEVEREEPPAPRPGLAVRAIARAAEYVVENEPRDPAPQGSAVDTFLRDYSDEPPEIDVLFGTGTRAPAATPAAPPPTDGPDVRPFGRFRADALVAACIALVGFGLVLSAVTKVRRDAQVAACQESLLKLHTGLAGCAANDPSGRYPQVGTPDIPTADAFARWLVDNGQLPANYKPGCPAAADRVAYTYTLGFREDGALVGLTRPPERADAGANDLMPISADLPAADAAFGAGPVSPHGGVMNVLFVGGNVRPTRSPLVGPNGDHIYCNKDGLVRAGIGREDAVLGRPGDRP